MGILELIPSLSKIAKFKPLEEMSKNAILITREHYSEEVVIAMLIRHTLAFIADARTERHYIVRYTPYMLSQG